MATMHTLVILCIIAMLCIEETSSCHINPRLPRCHNKKEGTTTTNNRPANRPSFPSPEQVKNAGTMTSAEREQLGRERNANAQKIAKAYKAANDLYDALVEERW